MAEIILKALKDAVGYLMGISKKTKDSLTMETKDDLGVVSGEKDKEIKENKEE